MIGLLLLDIYIYIYIFIYIFILYYIIYNIFIYNILLYYVMLYILYVLIYYYICYIKCISSILYYIIYDIKYMLYISTSLHGGWIGSSGVFSCDKLALRMFSGSGYLHCNGQMVWPWHFLVNPHIYIHIYISTKVINFSRRFNIKIYSEQNLRTWKKL